MNVWECDVNGCTAKAMGTGPAYGLRAIGWFFASGIPAVILCPAHHPNPGQIGCRHNPGFACNLCAAHAQAVELQLAIAPVEMADYLSKHGRDATPDIAPAANNNGTKPAREP